jgi:ammonia channel protein AmtB
VVLMMTIPGLALFYSGMVRKKNVLATMAQSLAAVATISGSSVAFGYSLVFAGDGPWIGTLDRWFLAGMAMDGVNPAAKTIPEALFMLYQMTFAIITALVAGSVAGLMRFSVAHFCFPSAGSCSSTCRWRTGSGAADSSRAWACWILPAASWCISPPVSADWWRRR